MNEEKMNEMLRRQIEAETPDILNDLLAQIDAGKAGSSDDVADGNPEIPGKDEAILETSPGKDEVILETGRGKNGVILETRQGKGRGFRRNGVKKKPGRGIFVRFATAAASLLLTFFVGWYTGNITGLHGENSKITQEKQMEQSGQQQKPTEDKTIQGQSGQNISGQSISGENPSGQQGGQNISGTQAVLASVTLDVNPSVRMEIGRDRRVISCSGLNKEGKDIVSMMDLTGADVTVASYAVVGGMLSNGYLTDISNSVLVSVESDQKEEGVAIEAALSESLKNYLENSSIGAAIVGQYVQTDASIQQFASDNSISDGKAWIIKSLVSANERLSEESLLKLSTQELLLLWTGRDKETTIYGNVSEKKYVGRDQALEAACKHVGVDQAQAEASSVEFDCDDGVIIYEVEFISGGRAYEIEVRADDGSILESDTEEKSSAAGMSGADYDDDDRDDDDHYESDDDDADDRYTADDDDVDDRYETHDDDADDRYESDDDDTDDRHESDDDDADDDDGDDDDD